MPKYVIEREMSGAGKLNSNQLKTAQTSKHLATNTSTMDSQITDDKILLHVHSA
jgi:hypothetical protein